MEKKGLIRKLAEEILDDLKWLSESTKPISVFLCYGDGKYYVIPYVPTGEVLYEIDTEYFKEVMSEWNGKKESRK